MKRLASLLLLLLATAARAGTVEGDAAWRAGDYPKALAAYRPSAEAGDAEAQMRMGDAYRLGRGVAVDQEAALGWYRRAAALGNLRARDSLGLTLFALGRRAEALPILEQGVAGGDPRVLYVVGTARFNGDNTARDWPLAYALMTRAAGAGLPQARTSLEVMERYLFPADKAKAQALLAGGLGQPAAAGTSPVRAPAAAARPARTGVMADPGVAPSPFAARPMPAVAARPAGEWKVQLGAFGSATRAEAAWAKLTVKVAGLRRLDKRVIHAGAVTRLQAGGVADGPAAAELCRAVKAAGGQCLAMAPGR